MDDNFLVTVQQTLSATIINCLVACTNYVSLYSQPAEKCLVCHFRQLLHSYRRTGGCYTREIEDSEVTKLMSILDKL